MRVLWIAQNGGLFGKEKQKGTGGWIGALQYALQNEPGLEIAIAFPYSNECDKINDGNVTYFPLYSNHGHGKLERFVKSVFLNQEKEDNEYVKLLKEVVESWNPDIIHIWGLEVSHAAVIPFIKKPLVVHIQGLTSVCSNNYLPPFFSVSDLKKADSIFKPHDWISIITHNSNYQKYKRFLYRGQRELKYAPLVKNWIGRTEWDKAVSRFLSPTSMYFKCNEAINNVFYERQWHYHYTDLLNIQTNISNDWYKGVDIILKCADLLSRKGEKFKWRVYGISRKSNMVNYMSQKLHIVPEKVNVEFMGMVTPSEIVASLITSDVYVHSSYAENSCNAIAEAMMLGLPIVAQYIGGNPSMLCDESGILVAPNEPFVLVGAILKMKQKSYAESYSQNAREVSSMRHDFKVIVPQLLEIYNKVIDGFKKA